MSIGRRVIVALLFFGASVLLGQARRTFDPRIPYFLRLPYFPPETSAPEKVNVRGAVERVSENAITLDSRFLTLTIEADENTTVWKGKTFHDFSSIEKGDKLSANCRREAGRLVAAYVEVNRIKLVGVITEVDSNGFEVTTDTTIRVVSRFSNQPKKVKQQKTVLLDSETVFAIGSKDDLKPDTIVQVVGLDLRNGRVKALAVSVVK